MKRAFLLWTGGKDSCLALHKAIQFGYKIVALVTFIPQNAEFRAHPLGLMRKQAESLGIKHLEVLICPPFKNNYKRALFITSIKLESDTVITGDIDHVDNMPNWIFECCEEIGLSTFFPLWKIKRIKLLEMLLEEKIEAVISYLNDDRLPKSWIGKTINSSFMDELTAAKEDFGIDITGENGEYHTMVRYTPLFASRIPFEFQK